MINDQKIQEKLQVAKSPSSWLGNFDVQLSNISSNFQETKLYNVWWGHHIFIIKKWTYVFIYRSLV